MAGSPLMRGAANRPLPALSNECGRGATLSDHHPQPWVLRQGKAQSLVPPLLKAFIAERLSRIPPLRIIAPRLLRGITIEISADGLKADIVQGLALHSSRRGVWFASLPRGHNRRRMPSLLAISDNGSGRAVAPDARAGSAVRAPPRPAFVIFEDTGVGAAAAAALEPVEHLCRRVDLVVAPAIGERAELVQIWGEPRCGVGQVDKAVLDHSGLRVHAHDLVELRLIAGHGIEAFGNQLLDQRGARGLVLNQYDTAGTARIAHAPRVSAPDTPCAAAIRRSERGSCPLSSSSCTPTLPSPACGGGTGGGRARSPCSRCPSSARRAQTGVSPQPHTAGTTRL